MTEQTPSSASIYADHCRANIVRRQRWDTYQIVDHRDACSRARTTIYRGMNFCCECGAYLPIEKG